MDSADFRKTCLKSGYACAYIADKYLKQEGDKNYTLDDLIEVSRRDEDYRTILDNSYCGQVKTTREWGEEQQ